MISSSNMVRKNRKRLGFTLIELLVVVLILGILMAIALPLYLSSVKTSARRVVAGNLKTMANASQAYKVKTGAYPFVTGDAAASLALIVGAGKDIESLSGPNNVSYSVVGSGNTFAVGASESASDDVFGTSTAGETVYYSPVYGKYQIGTAGTAPTDWTTSASTTDIP